MSAPTAACAAYREGAVLTATPAQLVVMLYDGAGRFLRQGGAALAAGDLETAGAKLARAEAILDELLVTLDREAGGEVAEHLASIYLFCRRRLTEARLEREPGMVGEVAALLGDLREAWAELAAP
jgi:flagellar protein FliS